MPDCEGWVVTILIFFLVPARFSSISLLVIGSRGLHSSHSLYNFLSSSSKSPGCYKFNTPLCESLSLSRGWCENYTCSIIFGHLSSKFAIYMEGKSGRYILPRWDLLQSISCRSFIDHFWPQLFNKEGENPYSKTLCEFGRAFWHKIHIKFCKGTWVFEILDL